MGKLNRKPPLCACGCLRHVVWNKYSKKWNVYINGHSSKGKSHSQKWRKNISLGLGGDGILKDKSVIECLCGCRQMTKPGCKYIHGHNRKNILTSENTKEKLSAQKTGDKNPSKRPEIKEKIAKSVKLLWKNLEYRKTHANCRWMFGLSKDPYSQDWTEDLKDSVRKRDNYECQLCYTNQNEMREKTMVHHINYNKKNCDPDNLISLCRSCHMKTNHNRDKWTSFFNGRERIAKQNE